MKFQELPISTLAYIGDAVYELAIRRAVLRTLTAKSGSMHSEVIHLVNASAQAQALNRIESELSETERNLVKRASNHSVPAARQVDPAEYRRATGFEALLGFLYLSEERTRLYELLMKAEPTLQFEDP